MRHLERPFYASTRLSGLSTLTRRGHWRHPLLHRPDWQRKREGTPLSRFAFHADHPPMSFYGHLAKGQTQASVVRAPSITLLPPPCNKSIEDPRQQALGPSIPTLPPPEPDPVPRWGDPYPDCPLSRGAL